MRTKNILIFDLFTTTTIGEKIMKLLLSGAVNTQAVVPGLEEVLKKLAAAKKLKYEWELVVVQAHPTLGAPAEFGAVLYPTRRASKKSCAIPLRNERRIVLSPLPDRQKVKIQVLEIGFGGGQSFAPLLGTKDRPQGGIRGYLNGDSKYVPDFFVIIDALGKILSDESNTSVSPKKEEQAA